MHTRTPLNVNAHFLPSNQSIASWSLSLAILISSMWSIETRAATRVVNPADSAAFATIQGAINASIPGDEIIVHPGTYTERINYFSKELLIRSLEVPLVTVINVSGPGFAPAVRCEANLAAGTALVGFTITGATNAGVFVFNSSRVEVRDCIFRNNSSTFVGGGIAVDNLSHVVAVNCLFHDNVAINGGAIGLIVSSGDVINCTIVRNRATGAPPFTGGGLFGLDSGFDIQNSILFGNIGQEPGQQAQFDTPNQFMFSTVNHTCMEGWDGSLGGTGNFGSDPLFEDSSGSDFRLRSGSPCVDAGDNSLVPSGVTSDLTGDPRFVDDPGAPDTGAGTAPLVDMGPFERVPTPLAGDVNCDGVVDLADGQAMVEVLIGLDQEACHVAAADLDGSGAADGRDIQPMIAFLLSP